MDPDSDPDPAIFLIDLQDANKKLICLFKIFYAYYFFKVHLHNFHNFHNFKSRLIYTGTGSRDRIQRKKVFIS